MTQTFSTTTDLQHPHGLVLPSQSLHKAIASGHIKVFGDTSIQNDQVQPASLDLRLGHIAYRVPASFLPGEKHTVESRLNDLQMHILDLTDRAVLEKGCVYIIPLMERLDLPPQLFGRANPKSSTGRLDVFARIITDGGTSFDDIPAGYKGPLYAEISPRTFSVSIRAGTRLVQLRLKQISDLDRLSSQPDGSDGTASMSFTMDVTGTASGSAAIASETGMPPIVGYRARKHAGLIDVEKINHYDPLDFWEPVFARRKGGVVLDPDDFYILATRESVSVPPNFAAEMRAYDVSIGEFRVHYAGFFDPGFGWEKAGGGGSRAVLEVRTHEVPFLIDEDQIVGRLVYEPLIETPDILYGQSLKSNYQGQSLALSKQFKR